MLRFKHMVMIAVAAVVGMIVGYVLVAGTNDGPGGGPKIDAAMSAGAPSSAAVASTTNGRATVPDLRGTRLSDAETQLAAAGYRKVTAEDATAQGRVVLEKENWLVDSQDPAAGTVASADTAIVLKVKKGTDDSTPEVVAIGVVPNVVCAELQAAQDALRGSGFLLITSTDGTGQGRVAILDRNWVVIGQSAEAGTKPSLTTHIVLTVVKHGESTGSSGCKG